MAADDVAEIERVLMAYVESYIQADVEALRDVFAHDAVMYGYVGDRLVEATPAIFIENVGKAPAIASTDAFPRYDIGDVQIRGHAASVTIQEYDFGGLNFTDFMHLLKRDDGWKIVSKTFSPF